MFRILQGGVVRYPLDATTSGTNSVWNAGQIVELDPTTDKVVIGSGAHSNTGSHRLSGLAIEDDSLCVASGKVSLLLSDAVVQTDQLAAGITFQPGNLVYMDASGNLTTSATVSQVFGKAITDAVASAGDILTFLYSPVQN